MLCQRVGRRVDYTVDGVRPIAHDDDVVAAGQDRLIGAVRQHPRVRRVVLIRDKVEVNLLAQVIVWRRRRRAAAPALGQVDALYARLHCGRATGIAGDVDRLDGGRVAHAVRRDFRAIRYAATDAAAGVVGAGRPGASKCEERRAGKHAKRTVPAGAPCGTGDRGAAVCRHSHFWLRRAAAGNCILECLGRRFRLPLLAGLMLRRRITC